MIISASLTYLQEDKLLRVIRDHHLYIGWTIADINGINPNVRMHKILLEEGSKSTVEQQRHLNPIIEEVVKKIIIWLGAGIIFPIVNSS